MKIKELLSVIIVSISAGLLIGLLMSAYHRAQKAPRQYELAAQVDHFEYDFDEKSPWNICTPQDGAISIKESPEGLQIKNKMLDRIPNKFGMANRVIRLKPGKYTLAMRVSADGAKYGCCEVFTNQNWSNAIQIPAGTYESKEIIENVNGGPLPLCIVSENGGKARIENIRIQKKGDK